MDKAKGGYSEGLVSILLNNALFALKLWAGITSGSIALVADAWHTLSDSISSVVVVIAIKLSSRKADKEHPFGYGRWEQIASIFIAFFLGIIGFEFLKESIAGFRNREEAQFGLLAIVVTVISIVVKEGLAQYAFYIARKTGNASVKADGWHHRSDALSSVVVLAGILFAKNIWWIDSALGIIIAVMLFHAAYEVIKESVTNLLGEQPSPELIEQITEEVRKVYLDDLQLHDFQLHNYITHKELIMHIRLRKELSIDTGHQIASVIEKNIQKRFGIHTTIHVEPLL
jgi:cation diffusion facilitator family transporter